MTLSQGYRMAQAATHKQPCLDSPYLGIPDEEYTIIYTPDGLDYKTLKL